MAGWFRFDFRRAFFTSSKACFLAFLMSSPFTLPVIAASAKAKTAIDNKTAVLPPIIKGDAAAGKLKSEDGRCLECHNDAGGVMNITTKSLTDAEVQALADYISGL